MRQTHTAKCISTWLKADVNFPAYFLSGYEPMKGDWVQAKYYINPTQWTTQARSVVPLRYRRLDQVIASLKLFGYTHSLQFSTSVAFVIGIALNSDKMLMLKSSIMSF